MKIEHNINKLSKVSFTSRPHLDMQGQSTGQMVDIWEEVPNVTAKGFDELQGRIAALEKKLEDVLAGDKIVDLMEKLSRMKDTREKPPKEPPKPGIPLSKLKRKGKPKLQNIPEEAAE